ncbi:hypothetical protein [Nocardia fusca]|uniref:hypothetical protein n=1 Tax=Nocardia fusca TaxID=941183 RepID=UPI0007A760F4|nr:hypothetical protein [Nocardia fusca]
MSAFIVSNGHIDVVVNAIAQYGITPNDARRLDYRALGQLLWDENVRSVDHRYRESNPRDRYVLHTTEGDLDPVAVLKAVDCYVYQSCEHPGWADSDAHTWMTRLREAIYTATPGYRTPVPSRYSFGETEPAYLHEVEYERRPWPFPRLEDALAVRAGASAAVGAVTAEA